MSDRYKYTAENRTKLAKAIVAAWAHGTLSLFALSKLVQEYDSEESFQEDANHYVEDLNIDIPKETPKMTPQMDLSNVDSDVVERARTRAEAEAIAAIRRRYDVLNREASALLEATGYVSVSSKYSAEISVEQALRAAEFVATAAHLAEERDDHD